MCVCLMLVLSEVLVYLLLSPFLLVIFPRHPPPSSVFSLLLFVLRLLSSFKSYVTPEAFNISISLAMCASSSIKASSSLDSRFHFFRLRSRFHLFRLRSCFHFFRLTSRIHFFGLSFPIAGLGI